MPAPLEIGPNIVTLASQHPALATREYSPLLRPDAHQFLVVDNITIAGAMRTVSRRGRE